MPQEQQTAPPQQAPTGALRAAMEERAVLKYLPVAAGIARRFARNGPGREDLAEPAIRGELKRYLRDKTWVIQPPRGFQDLQVQATREHVLLCQVLGHQARLEELAMHLGQPVREMVEAVHAGAGRQPEPLEALREGRDPHDRLTATQPDGFAKLDDSLPLAGTLQQLAAEEKFLLHRRYVDDRSQQEIGTRMRMTRGHVSRALSRILTKLNWHVIGRAPAPTGHEKRAA